MSRDFLQKWLLLTQFLTTFQFIKKWGLARVKSTSAPSALIGLWRTKNLHNRWYDGIYVLVRVAPVFLFFVTLCHKRPSVSNGLYFAIFNLLATERISNSHPSYPPAYPVSHFTKVLLRLSNNFQTSSHGLISAFDGILKILKYILVIYPIYSPYISCISSIYTMGQPLDATFQSLHFFATVSPQLVKFHFVKVSLYRLLFRISNPPKSARNSQS